MEATAISGPASVYRTFDVDDGQSRMSLLPAAAQRFQRIDRLSGLGDDDDQRILLHERFLIDEFRGDVDFRLDPGDLLEQVPAQQTRMVGSSAGDDDDMTAVGKDPFVDPVLPEIRQSVADASFHGRPDRFRLFRDLLLHVEGIALLIELFDLPVQFLNLLFDRIAAQISQGDPVMIHFQDRFFREGEIGVGKIRQRHQIRCQHPFFSLFRNDDRGDLADRIDLIRPVRKQDDQGIGPFDDAYELSDRSIGISLIESVQQRGSDFAVSAGDQYILQMICTCQFLVVFYDPVVYQRDLT